MKSPEARLRLDVAVVGFDGCMTSALTGLCDAMQFANVWAIARGVSPTGVFEPRVIAPGSRVITGSGGFSIPAVPIDPAMRPDLVLVPPIMAPVLETVAENSDLVEWLRSRQEAVVASVCGGAFFLAEAGLLGGRRATTNPAFADQFRRSYPDVSLEVERRLIDTGRILTAGSTTSFLDLIVYLVDRFAGHEIAVLTAKALSIDISHRSQLPYFLYVAPKDHGDAAVLRLQEWIEEHYRQRCSPAALAKRAGLSQRSLNRRFAGATGLTPISYVHRVRIEAAKHLLETSTLNVAEVTEAVGYQDARSFSRLFRSHVGGPPGDYRRRFGPAAGITEAPSPEPGLDVPLGGDRGKTRKTALGRG